MRDRGCNLNDAITIRHFPHRRDDPVAHRAFELERVTDHKDRFTFIRQIFRKLSASSGARQRHLDTQQREVAFFIDRKRPVYRKNLAFAVESLDLCANRSTNHVKIRHDLAGPQKETAAGHQRFAIRVVSSDRDNRRLYSFYEIGESFVCMHGCTPKRGDEENQCKGEQTRIVASLNHVVNTQTKTETSAREGDSRTGDLAVSEKMKWL